MPEIKAAGGVLIAISPQLPDKSMTTAERHTLTFRVLSDVGNAVARRFGLVFELPDYLRPVYQGFNLDLGQYNGEPHAFELPIPATFIIDREGIIRLAFVDPDYTRRLEPAEVVTALKSL